MPITVFIGGARSGKSSLAVGRAREWSNPGGVSVARLGSAVGERQPEQRGVAFVVTGVAGDTEMEERIGRHRFERDPEWFTVEAPRDLLGGVNRAISHGSDTMVVLDCLSFWVANRLMDDDIDRGCWPFIEERLAGELVEVTRLLALHPATSVIVTNEVGSGLVPDSPLGRQFRDTLGRMNAIVSLSAESAYLVVAGRILALDKP